MQASPQDAKFFGRKFADSFMGQTSTSTSVYARFLRFSKQTDICLFLLLVGITHYLLWVKIIAVALVFLYSLVEKKKKWKTPPLPFFFYLLMPIIGLAGAWTTGAFQFAAYPYVLAYGWAQWLVSAAGFWLLYLRISNRKTAAENSLYAFTALNVLATLYSLGNTLWESGSWWPYALADSEKYGLSTGDYIRGIFGGSSMVNAVCSALILLYFTQKKEWLWASAALLCMWLCGSNLTFLLTLGLLAFQILKWRGSRKSPLLFLLLATVGYTGINFRNMPYLVQMSGGKAVVARNRIQATASGRDLYENLRSNPSARELREAATVLSQSGSPLAANGSQPPDTLAMRDAATRIYHQPYERLPAAYANMPLKGFAVFQTLHYVAYHPLLLPVGSGMGNASSKLALKVTGAGFQGRWPAQKAYVGTAFYAAHLQDLLYLFSQHPSQHSIAHFPNNVYLQLLSEYGLAGLLLFVFLYIRYFAKRIARSTTKPWALFLFTGLLLATDYWLESLSVLVIFEALVLLSLQENAPKADAA